MYNDLLNKRVEIISGEYKGKFGTIIEVIDPESKFSPFGFRVQLEEGIKVFLLTEFRLVNGYMLIG